MKDVDIDVVFGQVTILVAQNVQQELRQDQDPDQGVKEVDRTLHQVEIVVDAAFPRLPVVLHPQLLVVVLLLNCITFSLLVPDDAVWLVVGAQVHCLHRDSTHHHRDVC